MAQPPYTEPTAQELTESAADAITGLTDQLQRQADALVAALSLPADEESAGHLDTSLFHRWNSLASSLEDVETSLKKLKAARESLETRMLDNLSRSGVHSLNAGERTFFVRIERWARAIDGDNERAIQVLKATGHDDLVAERFNTQTVSAFVRELFAEEEDFNFAEHPLAEGFILSETPKLGTRKS